jgi:chloride channel 3/4/5
LNQLPFLDSKHEYLWGGRTALEVADKEIPIIRADKPHTVRTLTGKLLELARKGMIDGGFPVLTKEIVEHDGRSFAAMRIVGFLGMNELEHALGESPVLCVDVDWEAE